MSATPVHVRGQQSRPAYPMAQGNQGGFNTKRIAIHGKRISDMNVLNVFPGVKRTFSMAGILDQYQTAHRHLGANRLRQRNLINFPCYYPKFF